MHRTKRGLLYWVSGACIAAVAAVAILPAHAESPAATAQLAAVPLSDATPIALSASPDRLKTDAMAALRKGEYSRSTELLKRAAANGGDPSLEMMASWVSSFNAQYEQTLAGRKVEHDKAVARAQLLLQKEKPEYALDAVARAYTLALDKRAFRAEPWVDGLVQARAKAAEQAEKDGQYDKSTRIYARLAELEPSNPVWKSRLKKSSRHLQVMALYTPGQFKALQKSKQKSDEEVDEILKAAGLVPAPTTQSSATTQPATSLDPVTGEPVRRKPDADAPDVAIDWREMLKGIEFEMIPGAMRDAVTNYYRDVNYQTMTLGGLQALRLLATTPGIDVAFPKLNNKASADAFLALIDEAIVMAKRGNPDSYSDFRAVVTKVREGNRTTVDLPESVVVHEFMDGALEELDPFSSMIWPQQLEEFRTATEGEFSGVGIQIERDESGDLKVVSPIEDTPAYRAGIKAGDMITHINGELAKGMMLDQAVKRIKGPSGTRVTLTVRSPDGKVKDHSLKRDTVKVASVKGWKRLPGGGWNWIVDPVQRIGYVRLTNFSKTSLDDLDRAVKQMQAEGAKGMVLDVRSDPGGLLTTAVDIADRFIKEGTIVSTKADRETPQSPSVNEADPGSKKLSMPIVVLVNQFSASASEILAGALKDHNRALIVGERTYGKGSVQMLFRVAGRNAVLKLTTSHYYLPSGRCLHREENSTEWGVDPDFKIEMSPEQVRAVLDARQAMDVVYAPDEQRPAPTTKPTDLLQVDPQLGAAVMLMRLQVAGVQL